MNIEAIVFLIIIGIIVILTVTEKNDREDTKGVIDFKNSHDINGDIKKLKAKINDDAKSARDTKRLFITLIIIISVILIGFIVIAVDLILNREPHDLLEKDNDKEIEKDIDDEKEKEDDNKVDNNKDIKLDDLGVVSDYIKDAESAGNCDMEVIKKDITYREDAIKDGSIEIYLVKDNKTLKLENTETIEKLLSDYFKSSSYEKLFVINGDGILTKYIYIAKD